MMKPEANCVDGKIAAKTMVQIATEPPVVLTLCSIMQHVNLSVITLIVIWIIIHVVIVLRVALKAKSGMLFVRQNAM